jgi:folylpolyglutamate synthase/dihydropteroate synthase
VEAVTPVAQAVTEALDRASEDDIIVVAGSLYVAGEARIRVLGRRR